MRLGLFISFLFISAIGFGQKLDASISKSRAKIGEPLTIHYKVKTDQKDVIVFHEKYDEIPLRTYGGGQLSGDGVNAEITVMFDDSSNIIQGGKLWQGEYTVMIWDSGTFIIPGPEIFINDSTFIFDDLRIYCDFSDKKAGIDLYDIRENYAELPPEENALYLWAKKQLVDCSDYRCRTHFHPLVYQPQKSTRTYSRDESNCL